MADSWIICGTPACHSPVVENHCYKYIWDKSHRDVFLHSSQRNGQELHISMDLHLKGFGDYVPWVRHICLLLCHPYQCPKSNVWAATSPWAGCAILSMLALSGMITWCCAIKIRVGQKSEQDLLVDLLASCNRFQQGIDQQGFQLS